MIYLDNASSTTVDPKVLEAMIPYFSQNYGNPSSINLKGLEAKQSIDNARKSIASIINCSPSEIIFTSGGTESNNLAIKGIAKTFPKKKHIIISQIEHSSIINPCEDLKKQGYEISYIKVDKEGIINTDQLKKLITEKTALVSIIYANNEIGTIQDIKKIANICKEKNTYFHTDACQAVNFLDINVKNLELDLMTINSSKIYGPKGIGALYVKKRTKISPIIFGGGQEKGLRSGTLNSPGIIGMAKAMELVVQNKEKNSKKINNLTNLLLSKLLKHNDFFKLNGNLTNRIPNNINIQIQNIEGKEFILLLNENNICASTGSACNSGKENPSHVLKAIGLSDQEANSSIRLTLGKFNKEEEMTNTANIILNIVNRIKN